MISPLIVRELRGALRKKVASIRFWTAVSGVLICVLHLALRRKTTPLWVSGQELFQWLLLISSVNAVYGTVHLSIDLLSQERRNDTLGLLVLTGLNGGQIVLGKLMGVFILQLSNSFALWPCFGAAFLLGGISGSALAAALIFLVNLTFLTLAVSMAASALSRDDYAALWIALGVGGVIGLASPAVYYASQWLGRGSLGQGWLLLSPLYGLRLAWEFFRASSLAAFWVNSAITFGYATGLIGLAAYVLHNAWREGAHLESPVHRWSAVWRRLARFWTEPRRPHRGWVDPNPYVWRALRDQGSLGLAWAGTGLVAAGWLGLELLWTRTWAAPLHTILLVLVIDSLVGFLAMFSAARTVAEDRRTGALELLLTTPLSVEEIMHGQRRALWLGFRPLLWSLLIVNVSLALITTAARLGKPLAAGVCLECWAVVACLVLVAVRSNTVSLVMWAALNSGRSLFAIRKAVCPPGVLVCFVFFAYSLTQTGWLATFPEGTALEFRVVTCILSVMGVLAAISGRWDPSSLRLKRDFRKVAQQPLPEPSDPRFRGWDVTKPFPQRAGLSGVGI